MKRITAIELSVLTADDLLSEGIIAAARPCRKFKMIISGIFHTFVNVAASETALRIRAV